MVNRVIHVLSNQVGPFDLLKVPANYDFIPRRLRQEQSLLRTALYLDQSDYYLAAVLSALTAYPDIASYISENVQTYDPSRIRPDRIVMTGGEFLIDKNMAGRFLDNDHELPLNLRYTIDYLTPTTAMLKGLERNQVAVVKYTVSGTDPSKLLRIEWPEGFPFTGPIRLQQVWTSGSQIEINVFPKDFPYTAYVTRVANSPYLLGRLSSLLLTEEFFASEDPIERTAMIAVAMVTDDVETEPIILPDERLVVEEKAACISADSILFTADTTLFSADNVCTDH